MNYAHRWRLAVALKQPYPSPAEAGALEMVPGSEPPVFIDRLRLFQSASITDPQRKADLKVGFLEGLTIGVISGGFFGAILGFNANKTGRR